MKEKRRQANIELLRILAMFMVVILHYLTKGGALISMVENTNMLNLWLWYVEALCIVTINVYVLISGYFLIEAKWKISRLIKLWFQVMFYSVGVPVVCLVFNIGEVKRWGLYDWINVLFPIQMEHYWFMTAYVVFYLFLPALSIGVKKLSKKQHKLVIWGLLLVFSVPKSILPIGIPTDRYGYDYGWFLCLFMLASYVRLYGINFMKSWKKSLMVYGVSVTGIWGISLLCAILSQKGLPLKYAMDMPYCYNHILVLVAALSLFYVFYHIQIPEGKVERFICRISRYSLGVYLLHENMAIRTKWQLFAGIEGVKDSFQMIPHMILTVIAIFTAGVLVDFVRECIFE